MTFLLDVEAVAVARPLIAGHLPVPERRHRIGRRSGCSGAEGVEAWRRMLRGVFGGDARQAEPRGVLRRSRGVDGGLLLQRNGRGQLRAHAEHVVNPFTREQSR